MEPTSKSKRENWPEIVKVFLRLGVIGFGGPAAHIAMMEQEVVVKRKWMSRQHFLDLVGATNLIPGPNSTEMTMHCGHERGGIVGLFLAGISFIFPAVVLTLALAWFYVSYGMVPEISPVFEGIKPAVLAIIIGAVFKLGKKALKNYQLGVIGALVLLLAFFGLTEVIAILVSGVLAMLWFGGIKPLTSLKSFAPILLTILPAAAPKVALNHIFWVFLKVGTVLFGSGYVLVAYLDGELIDKLGWLTESQLLDAVAMGQFTPGPVLTTATFVGYQLQGIPGALMATAGIFLPSFLFVLLLNPIVPKIRKSKLAGSFLDGVNVGAIAIMVAVAYNLLLASVNNWSSAVIFILAMVFTFGPKKLSSVYIVLGGMLFGYLFSLL